jgi:hypothetical protein
MIEFGQFQGVEQADQQSSQRRALEDRHDTGRISAAPDSNWLARDDHAVSSGKYRCMVFGK